MAPWMRTMGEKLKQRLRLDVGREICRQYPLFCFLLLCLSAASLLLNRYLHVLMIFWSFVAGVVTFYCSLGPDSLLPNIFFTIKYKPKQLGLQELFPQGRSCAVCGKVKCKRHRPALLLENYQPWLDLKISSKVDASLSEVLELVLENFVYPWYRDVTDDEFVDELRIMLRFFASVLIRRIHKVDIPSIITKKLLKAAMKHIEVIVKASQKVENTEFLQQAALEEYGPELHVALRSRRDELHYLRKLTELLFPYILPPKATDCRSLTLLLREILSGSVFLPSLDFLADPDVVNHLLIIFIDDSPPEKATEPPSPLVPFLQKFAEPRNKKPSVLKLELKQIREQQDLLFRFMNFLKQEGAVHVLQICLTVEEFNDRILRPELSNDEMLSLHEELQKIYKTYCLDESIDKIRFDPFIVEEIQKIAEGPYIDVVKLQTMRCLFEAYEHVLSLLENVFTPMFCHSDEYFRQLLRGAESPTRNSKFNRGSLSLDDFRSTQKRGESFGISRIGSKIKGVFKSTTMEGAMLPNYGLAEGEDDFIEEGIVVMEDDSPMEAVNTPNTPNLAAWKISIPYVDFFEDTSSERKEKKERIPVFCIDVERNDRRAKLLQHPELSNSQLLADFLSPNGGETQFLDKILPDVNLGKIIKSVPGKLMKEKGQHLEPFIMNFINSCESPKPKPSKPELTILSPTSENNKKLFNDLFKNNANRAENTERKQNQNYFMEMMTVEGVYDYLMYVDAVFCENTEPRSLQDKQKRAKQTFEEMMNYIPDLIVKCIGEEAKYKSIRLLFDGLQQPVLNKQLTYVLLDIVIQELFPELNKVQKEVTSVTSWI
uniref:Sorting nexin-14 n=1 Tax=Sus scrofa TaxID=9823 RepID=A0A8W4FHX6_PIG